MKITALFRQDAVEHNPLEGASEKNPGGGLAVKAMHLQKALPSLEMITEASEMADLSIVDVLYFSGGNTLEDKLVRMKEYRKQRGYKILWTSDFEIFRLAPEHREEIFDTTDIIAANSPYMYELLTGYFNSSKIALLTDPIDTDVPEGAETREPTIYSCSQIILEKGIDELISLYKGLAFGAASERSLERVFIGSSETWGVVIRDQTSFDLEMRLEAACNQHYWSLTNAEVQALARVAQFYVSFSRFETFGYALVEALLGGCTVLATGHLAYRDRIDAGVVIQVDNVFDARHQLKKCMEQNEPKRNEAAIQFVHDNYSLNIFRNQFKGIIGKLYGI